MGRYLITLKDGEKVGADDVRINGNFVEYIPRYVWNEKPVVAVNGNSVEKVEKVDLGYQGGKRFDGTHDGSFKKTTGSL